MKSFKDYRADSIDCTCESIYEELVITESEYQGKKVELNNPFRLPSGSKKKFGV